MLHLALFYLFPSAPTEQTNCFKPAPTRSPAKHSLDMPEDVRRNRNVTVAPAWVSRTPARKRGANLQTWLWEVLQGSFVGMASTVFTLSEHAATQAFFTQVMALSLEHAPKTPLPFLPHCSMHGTGQSLKARSARCGKVGHVQNYETRRPK